MLSEEKIIKSEDDKDDDIEKVVIKKRKEKHVKEKTEVKKNAKKYCCIYCKKIVSKLMKHFSHIHKEEKDVKIFLTLPPGCPEMRQLIDRLRTEGNFKYNTSSDVKENEIILTRVNNILNLIEANTYHVLFATNIFLDCLCESIFESITRIT